MDKNLFILEMGTVKRLTETLSVKQLEN